MDYLENMIHISLIWIMSFGVYPVHTNFLPLYNISKYLYLDKNISYQFVDEVSKMLDP